MAKITDITRSKTPTDPRIMPRFATASVDVKKIDSLIYHKGVIVRLYPILPCPNIISIDDSQHNINCKLCTGKGYIDDRNNYYDTVVLITTQQKELLINPENIGGNLEQGEAFATFLSGINLTYLQKFELINFSRPYYQHVQRQNGNSDRLHYSAKSVSSIMDKNGKTYTNNVDYKITESMIEWIGTNQPSTGIIYSINYQCLVTYRCMEALHRGRYVSTSIQSPVITEVEFSEQWKVKESFLVDQSKSDGTIIDINNIFPPGK